MLEYLNPLNIGVLCVLLVLLITLQYFIYSIPAAKAQGLVSFYFVTMASFCGYKSIKGANLRFKGDSGFVKREDVNNKVISVTRKLQIIFIASSGSITGIDIMSYLGVFAGIF